MTAVAQSQPAVSIAGPQHTHTRRCYWDCREARWQCPQDSAAVAPAGSATDTAVALQP